MNVSPRSVRDAVLVENDGDSELVTAIKKGRQHSRRIVESIREIGDKLVQTKAKLPDGSFSPWLESALGWSIEHARRFIEVRDRLNDGDAEELGVIDLSALRIAASFAGDQLVKPAEEAEPGIQAAR